MDSKVYPEKLAARGSEYLRPTPEEREEINRIIMDELVCGDLQAEGVAYFQRLHPAEKCGLRCRRRWAAPRSR